MHILDACRSESGEFQVVELTVDHTPSVAAERGRLEAEGAFIEVGRFDLVSVQRQK